jgi:hypothetical protein
MLTKHWCREPNLVGLAVRDIIVEPLTYPDIHHEIGPTNASFFLYGTGTISTTVMRLHLARSVPFLDRLLC